jgi:RNA polymerase sigma factor (sigma-70 family)
MNMAVHRLDAVIHSLRNSTCLKDDDPSDGHLLDQFIENRSELAFATLVQRHGPMVWGVCRRIVLHHHDAEDAFQAAFLVLARNAASVRPRDMVASWLFGVAQRTALKARAAAGKRQAREKQVESIPEVAAEERTQDSLGELIGSELVNLPDIYRVVIVLCDLEGRKGKDVARHLRIPEGTLATRLRTARMMLAKRLARRGVLAAGAVVAAWCAHAPAFAAVPGTILARTVDIVSGVVPLNVLALTEGVVKGMALTKLKNAISIFLVLGAVIFGGALISCYAAIGQEPQSDRTSQQAPELKSTPATAKQPDKASRPIEKVEVATVSYSVPDLVLPIPGLESDGKPGGRTKEDWLIRKITQTIAPGSWKQNGGKGTIDYHPAVYALIVSNTVAVQSQVNSLLETMRRFQDVQVACDVQILSANDATFGKLENLVPRLKKDGQAILSPAETFAMVRKAQDNPGTTSIRGPKITLFLGQAAAVSMDTSKDKKAEIKLIAYVAANLSHVDLDVQGVVSKIEFKGKERLEDGMTLVQVRREGSGYLTLLVTPRVIVASEVIETPPAPKTRAKK